MKLLKLVVAITVLATACSQEEKDQNGVTLNSEDKIFAEQVTYFNLGAVTEGGIAISNGRSDSVKTFGHLMVMDHGQAQDDLNSLDQNLEDLQLPSATDSVHEAMATQLQALSGYEFDTTYIGFQIRDHIYTIDYFNSEIALGNNQQLVDYAIRYLPMVRMHLQEAQAVQETLH